MCLHRFPPAIRILALLCLLALVANATVRAESKAAASRPNVLFISVDDMNWDSLGCTGCKVPNISPNIDRLASQGLRFEHAHVTIAVCQPTRSVWFTGRYPHRNGALGFQPINVKVPTLTEQTKKAGYLNGIMAKVAHLAPQRKFAWDVVVNPNQLRVGRDPELYYKHAKAFFERAKKDGKPFFLMANSQDPHRPFAGSSQEAARKKPRKRKRKRRRRPANFPGASRTIEPKEVEIPPFLPDVPLVRKEIAEYYTSVHRADEIVGAVLKALKEAGLEENTLVVFLSDHGMPLPFAKTNCYLNSTRTPLIVRWPGTVKAGAVDKAHMISGIDLMPTILDALKLPRVKGMDGRSFLPVLRGEKQDGREELYTVFHRTAGRRDYPMRSVITRKYGYIYNGWSDGKTVFRNESQSGRTFRAMVAAGRKNPKIAARVKLFQYRVKEEFFDYEQDPHALKNLVDDPKYAKQVSDYRQRMRRRMVALKDPLLKQFANEVLVTAAIRRGQEYLVKKQIEDGYFPSKLDGHKVGVTSLALLALLDTGIKPSDKPVQAGLRYLRGVPTPMKTYDAGLMLAVLSAVGEDEDKPRIAKLATLLREGQATRYGPGGWSYNCRDELRFLRADRCNTQFAILGLEAAARTGASVEDAAWKSAKKYWVSGQGSDGGWGYVSPKMASSGSMTAAGIASLILTNRMLKSRKPRDDNVQRGLRWLSKNLRDVYRNPGGTNDLYFMVALKRAARLSGKRFIKQHDWYREGSRYLIGEQRKDGSWVGRGFGETDRVIATSFALLFLSDNQAIPLKPDPVEAVKPKKR